MFIYLHIEELEPKSLDYPWYVATVSRLPASANPLNLINIRKSQETTYIIHQAGCIRTGL